MPGSSAELQPLTQLGSRLGRQHAALQRGDGCREQGAHLVPLLRVGAACVAWQRRDGAGAQRSSEIMPPRLLPPASTRGLALSPACLAPHAARSLHERPPLASSRCTFADQEGLPGGGVARAPRSPHHLKVLRSRDGAHALQGDDRDTGRHESSRAGQQPLHCWQASRAPLAGPASVSKQAASSARLVQGAQDDAARGQVDAGRQRGRGSEDLARYNKRAVQEGST